MSFCTPSFCTSSLDLTGLAMENTIQPLRIGRQTLASRLLLGTGRFASFDIMSQALLASGTDAVTIAVRRDRQHNSDGQNILDFIDLNRYRLLPNTSGCYDAATAVRCARMGREIMKSVQPESANWVKLEVLGDSHTLLPDPLETLRATEVLVADGFDVLCYTSDDPVLARHLQSAGAACVMPAGSPIGSGLGLLNRVNLEIIVNDLKQSDREFPVIVDAGIGTASDAALAMECGADAVLINSSIARATDAVSMSMAMALAVQAGFFGIQGRANPCPAIWMRIQSGTGSYHQTGSGIAKKVEPEPGQTPFRIEFCRNSVRGCSPGNDQQ